MAVPVDHAVPASLLCNQDPLVQEREASRQHFRQFQYTDAAGPREAFGKLWELCCQWLKPGARSLREILELLVLEQFLTILPTRVDNWVRTHGPGSRESLLDLLENFQRAQGRPEYQIDMDDLLMEELWPMGMFPGPPDMHPDSAAPQVMGPAQEGPGAEAWIPQPGPWELNYNAAGEQQPSADPGHAIPGPNRGALPEHGGQPWEQGLLDPVQEQLADYTTDGTMLPGPSVSGDWDQLEPLPPEPPEELLADFPQPVEPPGPCLTEPPESSEQEEPLQPGTHGPTGTGERPHCCHQCGQGFPSRRQLATHLKTHPGVLTHQCPSCEKAFLHKSDLTRHQHAHPGVRPYRCDTCRKGFAKMFHLHLHQRVHSRPKAWQCPRCEMRFESVPLLAEHKKSHAGEKCHSCPVCEKSFSKRAALTMHQKSHEEGRPFTCDYCQKSYRQKGSLANHLRGHTGEKADNAVPHPGPPENTGRDAGPVDSDTNS